MNGKTQHPDQTSVNPSEQQKWHDEYIYAYKKCKIFRQCKQTIRAYKEKK